MLSCSCCGRGLLDTPEQNVSHGQVPYPHDVGCGMCLACGGDPKGAEELEKAGADDEKVTRRAMGWAFAMFVDARVTRLREALNETNRSKLDAMPYSKKVEVVCRMVERGLMT